MAAIFSDFVKQGQVSVKIKKIGVWSKRWMVLRSYSSVGPSRLELYDETQGLRRLDDPTITPLQVAALTSVAGVYVGGKAREHRRRRKVVVAFAGCSKRRFKFRAESYDEAEQWRRAVEQVVSPTYDELRSWTEQTEINSSAFNATQSFRVFLLPSHRLPYSGECQMDLTANGVDLREFNPLRQSSTHLVSWEICDIRRFGVDSGVLKLETGRSSCTGEHIFTFRSFEAKNIERQLNVTTNALITALQLSETETFRQSSSYPLLPSRDSLFDYGPQTRPRQFYGITEEHRWVPDPPSLSSHNNNFDRRPCPMCSSKVDPRVLVSSVDDRERSPGAATSPDSTRRPSAPDPISGRFIGSESSKRRLYSVPAEVCSADPPPRSSPSSSRRAPPDTRPAFVDYGGSRGRHHHHHHLDRSPLFDPDLYADGPAVSHRTSIPIPLDPDYCDALGGGGGHVEQASFSSADPVPIPSDRRFEPAFDFQPRSRSRYRPPPPPPSSSFFKVAAAPTAVETMLARSPHSILLGLSPSHPIPVARDPRIGSPCARRRGPPSAPPGPRVLPSARSFDEASDRRRPRTPKPLWRGPLSTTVITRQLAKSERDLTQTMSLSGASIACDSILRSSPVIPPIPPCPSPRPRPRSPPRSPSPPPPVPERSFRHQHNTPASSRKQPEPTASTRSNRWQQQQQQQHTRLSRSFSSERRKLDVVAFTMFDTDSDSSED